MRKFRIEGAEAGRVWDVHTSLDNLERLYKRGGDPPKAKPKREDGTGTSSREPEVQRNSADYRELVHSLDVLQNLKSNADGGRNTVSYLFGLIVPLSIISWRSETFSALRRMPLDP